MQAPGSLHSYSLAGYIMEELKTKAGNLTESVTDYIQTYYKLSILKIADKSTSAAAAVVGAAAVVFLGAFVLFFGGIALGLWLGQIMENTVLGFVLVAGFFLLLMVVVLALRKKIIFPIIRNKIINKIYEEAD